MHQFDFLLVLKIQLCFYSKTEGKKEINFIGTRTNSKVQNAHVI